MRNCLIFLLLILPFCLIDTFCQKKKIVTGYIKNCHSGKPIPSVAVFNESLRTGSITDTSGFFRIYAGNTDTLILTCLGYLGKVIILDSMLVNRGIESCMEERQYEIAEAKIVTYGSYEQFKKEFLKTQPKEFRIKGLPEPKVREIPLLLDTNYIKNPEFLILHPLSYLYYNFSKEEKSKRKVLYLQKEQREQIVIDKKFSRELISGITGIKDHEEITAFMAYCNFSHKFLYEATEYEIAEAIDNKFRIYRKQIKMDRKEE